MGDAKSSRIILLQKMFFMSRELHKFTILHPAGIQHHQEEMHRTKRAEVHLHCHGITIHKDPSCNGSVT